jgi:hypothetical protein
MKFEYGVQESARRVTPSFLLVGLGLLVCLVSRGEGAASRAVFRLDLVFVRLVRLIVRLVRSVWSRLVGLKLCRCLRFCSYCDADFESFVLQG